MRSKVRSQEIVKLVGNGPKRPSSPPLGETRAAGLRLLETYVGLAERGEHLLSQLLGGEKPRQWRHYPEDDAIDSRWGYQWFYHCHSQEDRPGADEHGHIHLFARRKLWSRRLRSVKEIEFSSLADDRKQSFNTRHLICIGLDAKGVPVSLFTVNSWVTGDLMLSASNTALMLDQMSLDTGNKNVDAVVECIVKLYRDEIRDLLVRRDTLLFKERSPGVLGDHNLEVLSEIPINVDEKLARLAP